MTKQQRAAGEKAGRCEGGVELRICKCRAKVTIPTSGFRYRAATPNLLEAPSPIRTNQPHLYSAYKQGTTTSVRALDFDVLEYSHSVPNKVVRLYIFRYLPPSKSGPRDSAGRVSEIGKVCEVILYQQTASLHAPPVRRRICLLEVQRQPQRRITTPTLRLSTQSRELCREGNPPQREDAHQAVVSSEENIRVQAVADHANARPANGSRGQQRHSTQIWNAHRRFGEQNSETDATTRVTLLLPRRTSPRPARLATSINNRPVPSPKHRWTSFAWVNAVWTQ